MEPDEVPVGLEDVPLPNIRIEVRERICAKCNKMQMQKVIIW